jgi:hypothetical protein
MSYAMLGAVELAPSVGYGDAFFLAQFDCRGLYTQVGLTQRNIRAQLTSASSESRHSNSPGCEILARAGVSFVLAVG